jgi:hypothetical protein
LLIRDAKKMLGAYNIIRSHLFDLKKTLPAFHIIDDNLISFIVLVILSTPFIGLLRTLKTVRSCSKVTWQEGIKA